MPPSAPRPSRRPSRREREAALRAAVEAARDRREAPRLTPDQRIAGLVTRRGIFADHDPGHAGHLWTRWEWLGLVFWAAAVAGALARAWHVRGGLEGVVTRR